MKKEENKQPSSRYHVPNLERALKIFEFLADTPEGATLTDIARQLEFPKNSAFRILSTLNAHNYVFRDERQQHFRLSGKLLGLAYRGTGNDQLLEISVDILRALRDDSKETAFIGCLIDYAGVVLTHALSHQPVKVAVDPGTRFALHVAAPAKAIIAFLPENERNTVLKTIKFKRMTERTIPNLTAFRKELERVHTCGYSTDWGEELNGINCVAAPIFDHTGYPIASIWISGPDVRLDHEHFEKFGKMVSKSAKDISLRLGYAPEQNSIQNN